MIHPCDSLEEQVREAEDENDELSKEIYVMNKRGATEQAILSDIIREEEEMRANAEQDLEEGLEVRQKLADKLSQHSGRKLTGLTSTELKALLGKVQLASARISKEIASRDAAALQQAAEAAAKEQACGAAGTECPICFERGGALFALGCGHVLCEGCDRKWQEQGYGCPACRAPVSFRLRVYHTPM
jgi:hypothetical protein